mmetsp:Transcript_40769/g.72965  ORF Transcript_40769/g.72965 Transcript_40769/m.72965 type:complete len:176 (-) Transcript_40769:177-704(-)
MTTPGAVLGPPSSNPSPASPPTPPQGPHFALWGYYARMADLECQEVLLSAFHNMVCQPVLGHFGESQSRIQSAHGRFFISCVLLSASFSQFLCVCMCQSDVDRTVQSVGCIPRLPSPTPTLILGHSKLTSSCASRKKTGQGIASIRLDHPVFFPKGHTPVPSHISEGWWVCRLVA